MSIDNLGPYQIIKSIAKGGMGEVFLAYEPSCKREVALKSIRKELSHNKTIYKRFVKEALIASRLTHPNIIPIYTLSNDGKNPYYTMPYIEGQTLKQILVEAHKQQKDSKVTSSTKASIPSLVHIFLTVCEAVSYSHEQQIIHRDLKPENILVGLHGEVLISDWGVADKVENIAKEDPSYDLGNLEFPGLTSPGKIIGTLPFLAPERFFGAPSNYATDIYSLGVMLYMILTLRLPFKRKKVKEAKENLHKEIFRNPIDIAPYRDIPHDLVKITQKCLAVDPHERYQNMQELLKDLRNFTEGQSGWMFVKEIQTQNENDWAFKENVLISNHQAISFNQSALEWINLMISKSSFEINCQVETRFCLQPKSSGIGFLLNSPHYTKRIHIIDGYHLWLSADKERPSQLFRNNVEILKLESLKIEIGVTYSLKIEKTENRIQLYINDIKQFSYLSYLPLMGKHVGLLFKDRLFDIEPLKVFVATPSLIISCLQVPDTFLAEKNYPKALAEYRKIGKTFPGRHESREAFFRAGLAILEQAIESKSRKSKNELFDRSLSEFEHLRHTPGAPLEYLGKSLVYHEMHDTEEELKCLELALRRYPSHPLLYLIYDHIIYRLYQSSHRNRIATHKFVFLALRYNACAHHKQIIDPLVLNLTDRKRMLFFLEKTAAKDLQSHYLDMIISLCFLLKKSYVYQEILEEYTLDAHFVRNILINLLLLQEKDLFEKYLELIDKREQQIIQLLQAPPSTKTLQSFFLHTSDFWSPFAESIFFLLIEKCYLHQKFDLASSAFSHLEKQPLDFVKQNEFCFYKVLTALVCEDIQQAEHLTGLYKKTLEETPNRLLFLKGCLSASKEGVIAAKNLFSKEMENSILDIDSLGISFIIDKLSFKKWKQSAFEFEQVQLNKQLYLFHTISNSGSKASTYLRKWKKNFCL